MPPAIRITLLRRFRTDIDRLMTAWTDAPMLAHWWSTPEQRVMIAEIVARPGGPFVVVTYSAREGEKADRGRFRDVLARDALILELDGTPARTLTLQFWPLGDEVELTLTERPFADQATRDAREADWIAGLDRLKTLVEGGTVRR
ncbi:SRPBCC domain-containing protein [Sphingomonas sp. BGYR3]|uniref:SRPBCC family protein n=1 Tax=Sphingomonas sp. BGYR3 TaxID=2975483 RepID=UPI0021A8885D|nr:SRPBCC domain-containing protein [Sphingomonas sp. BGYR3]